MITSTKQECSICGYPHHKRPESFCIAVRDLTFNKPEVKDQLVKDILGNDLVNKLEARGIRI